MNLLQCVHDSISHTKVYEPATYKLRLKHNSPRQLICQHARGSKNEYYSKHSNGGDKMACCGDVNKYKRKLSASKHVVLITRSGWLILVTWRRNPQQEMMIS